MLIDVHAATLQLSDTNIEKSPLSYGYLLLLLSVLATTKENFLSFCVRALHKTEHHVQMSTSWPKPYHDNFESRINQQKARHAIWKQMIFWAQKDGLSTECHGGWHGSDFEALKVNIVMGREADSSIAA